MADKGSISCWIDGLRESDPEAQRVIWERFVRRLVRFSNRKLGSFHRLGDGEDVASMAFYSLFSKSPEEFEKIANRTDLWQYLSNIAKRRAIDQIRRENAWKRKGENGKEQVPVEEVPSNLPTAEFEIILAEELQICLEALPNMILRNAAVLRMEGMLNKEIASKLGLSLRSIERKFEEIRDIFKKRDSS